MYKSVIRLIIYFCGLGVIFYVEKKINYKLKNLNYF